MNFDIEQLRAASGALGGATPPSMAHVLDQLSEAILMTDGDWRVRYMNDAARRLAGMAARTASPVRAGELLKLVDTRGESVFGPDGLPRVDLQKFEGALALRQADGADRPIDLRVRPAAGGGWTLVYRDKTRERGLIARLTHQASHDALTGLPNRAAFERCLAEALASSTRADGARPRGARGPGAVLYLDIDQFKIVNDTCGHDVGDEVLRRLATALLTQMRGSDVLARLGGDEFGVLLPGRTINEARIFAARLRNQMARLASTADDERLAHTVSIGIAMLDEVNGSARRLLSAADVACFAAKERGRDRVEVYGANTGRDRQTQMEWVSRVRRACDDQRFVLYHQPIVPLGGKFARPHFELLLRMVDRSGKIIMPASFIPAAERFNVMSRVDRWTVRHVLTELVWREDRAPWAPYMLSVNLSGTSLRDPEFRRDVLDLVDRHPVAPDTLCFEITETAAVGDIGPVSMFMKALNARGCRFSLDDFGTGMASFAYLKDLPVDFLKIDGHFVHQLTNDAASASMVRAFGDIASTLGIRTVGERVEDAQTARALRDLGVDFAQGYYFERPRKLLNRLAFAGSDAPPAGDRVAV